MRASIPYIQQKFDEFNALCFNGQLLPLPIRLSRARTFLGKVEYKRRRQPDGSWHYFDFVFVISTLIDMPESLVEDTILHEMIHYYIFQQQLQDTSSHGVIFRRIMNELNERFNRHVSVRHKLTAADHEADTQRRQHLVCVSQLADGTVGLTLAARTRLLYLWDALPRIGAVKECRWYVTSDPYFNRFPRARVPKVYAADPQALEEHLKEARTLVRHGRTIHVVSQHVG